jgi:hypothetical protein
MENQIYREDQGKKRVDSESYRDESQAGLTIR